MTTGNPIECVWDGSAFRPTTPFWARRAAKDYAEGEVLHMADQPERSTKSHAFYFASINSAWKNLPEALADRFPTVDHLRRYALIKTGFCDTQSMPCPSHAAALRFAAFVRPIDEFALITVTDTVVTVYRAKSQSYKAMGREDFNKSKEAVLDVLADMIGVTRTALENQNKDPKREYTQLEYMQAG
jgi:hypothetical protein